ncbi:MULTISPECIES: IclR family transcriptional regulator [Pseudomonas]|uniref:DNA-binding IclR family transcriptional regulator n=1 Tax=Pseudomonas hunanensis TaxID=1247546 RepID=A0ACC6K5K3_9PSED|nr:MULTISPECIES: IclR family transcriptional regulator [Pseudomonas]MBP2261849.1 DNA-binding IclR family transcriptional regulator [Pseudomonas sp. BP8]MDR6713734.1 DNA-binding IclR family transcriptional regulator [Pseudomonas hunanensis]HDS1737114.1 IclR family transcriptional regulator [Pseudomonas putida]
MPSAVSTTETTYAGLLERGLAILEMLASSVEGVPLTEISDALRIPRSATHRLLNTLCDNGYVRQEQERGTYLLTSKLQVLAFTHLGADGTIDAVQPVLNRLAAEVGELVRLSVVDEDRLTWVARAQGARGGLRYDPDMGMEAKLSCSASGYAWLATMDNAAALALVAQQGFGAVQEYGPHAPQSPQTLLPRIETARTLGYALAIQTFADWMSAIAVPVFHPASGKVLGVVSIAGPVFRLSEARLHELAPALIAAAAQIQHLIAGSPALMSPQLSARNARVGDQA